MLNRVRKRLVVIGPSGLMGSDGGLHSIKHGLGFLTEGWSFYFREVSPEVKAAVPPTGTGNAGTGRCYGSF